jgi:hypothetical protein
MCTVQSWRFTECDVGGFWSSGILYFVFGGLTCLSLQCSGGVFQGW